MVEPTETELGAHYRSLDWFAAGDRKEIAETTTWTVETPTERGFYWWRANPEAEPRILAIRNGFAYEVDPEAHALDKYSGEWIGPLQPDTYSS